MTARPSLLIVSFSPIASDARVLKQVRLFAGRYDVTTLGYGPRPDGVVEHLQVPGELASRPPHPRLLVARAYSLLYRRTPEVAWARAALRGRRWDVVLADDVETVPLALATKPRGGVHADLHEFSPRLHEENAGWARWVRPYIVWMCRRHVRRADSWTTVSGGLAREYEKDFGFRPTLVTNAAPYVEAEPHPTGSPVRLVHSGACLRNRHLDVLVDAVERSGADVELHLYLTPNDPGHLAELAARAEQVANVVVHAPVPYDELAATLRGYDVGVHVLPPVSFNNAWALPNKIFDYVQARLGVVVGPSPEMAEVVRSTGIGTVTADFSATALAETLRELNPRQVDAWRAASHAHARELSAEEQEHGWADAVDALAARAGLIPARAEDPDPGTTAGSGTGGCA